MDHGYNIYAPRGFHSLMERSPAASDYFESLPEEVKARLMRHVNEIESEDALHALAQQMMRAR